MANENDEKYENKKEETTLESNEDTKVTEYEIKEKTDKQKDAVDEKIEILCPRCKAPMILRTAQKGKKQEISFMDVQDFPSVGG